VVHIRPEKSEDLPLVNSLIIETFKRDTEARLVDRLRRASADYLSLVADDNGTIVGHIMFTPATITNDRTVTGMGLAPMAVIPSYQHQGIGKLLVREGLRILQETGCPFVIVLGHPDYYPRFGFQPASRYNIRSQWDDVPDEAFMILIMDDKAMRNISGVARFRDEFNDAL
jgi:putative acetyltransferase